MTPEQQIRLQKQVGDLAELVTKLSAAQLKSANTDIDAAEHFQRLVVSILGLAQSIMPQQNTPAVSL